MTMTLLGISVTILGIGLVMSALNHDKLCKRVDRIALNHDNLRKQVIELEDNLLLLESK